ncbi:MAG TPA: SusC/RagA family TonB-linked outer membrane protein, partial [Bacteroidales bacterium]
KSEDYNISVQDLPYATQLWYNVGSAPTISGVSSNYTKWQIASFMGRVNYSYKDRYLVTASARYDGSSRLAVEHKWVLFPSAALAWRVTEEEFMKGIGVLNNLKLRAGFGLTGNSAISPYTTGGNLDYSRYNYGSTNVMAFYQSAMPNPDLSWEKTTQWNAGIDFGILKSRVSGVIDVYLQNTNDLLMSRQLPNVSGFSSVTYNIGKTRNKGIEITLNTVNIRNANFDWNSDFTFSRNIEEIVELYGGKNDDTGNSWFIGQPLSVYYDYKFLGIWQLDEAAEAAKFGVSSKPGTIKVLDVDGNYSITATDRQIIGTPRPKFVASLSNHLRYKNIDLNFFFNSSYGNLLSYSRDLRWTGRYNSIKANYWRVTEYDALGVAIASNGSNDAPRPNNGVEAIPYVSSMGYYNASFIRLSNATLGYNLPENLISRASISKLRVYLTMQNIFVITKYPGTDPESGSSMNVPNPRTTMFGINMSF